MAAAAGDSRAGGADGEPGAAEPERGRGPTPIPSGLLTQLPDGHTEAAVLAAALQRLTGLTRALSRNLRLMNGRLERTLQDKKDIDELEAMLNRFMERQGQDLTSR